MKAHIDADGVLHIAPETATEAFALRAYSEKALIWVDVPSTDRLSPTMDKKQVVDSGRVLIDANWPPRTFIGDRA